MRHIITSGGNLKGVDLGNPIRDSWDFVEAMKESGDGDLYARVSALNRAMNLTADAIANLPFAVTNEAGTEDIDTSQKWTNKIGILPNPRQLLRQWRLSLFMSNTAYGRIAKTNAIKRQMFYVMPENIEIETDNRTGSISGYSRKINGIIVERYAPNDKNLFKMWRLDHTTELLPSTNTEFLALANSAGVLYAADWWTKNYFKNGAVRPTLVSVKGMVIGEKKEDLQNSFAKFMRGIGRGFSDLAKIINGEAMDVKQIGDGLGDVKDSPVYKQAIENICMVSGIPLSVMLSNSANYATAQTEYAAWFRDSIVPWAYWMQENMNEQIFAPAGMRFEFRPEQTEPAQEEEVQRASAYQTYINAGMKPSLAAQVVGIDLPAGYEYEMLDPIEKEDTPKDVVESDTTIDTIYEDTEDTDEMSMKAWDELDTWKRKALRHAKRGQPVTFDFDAKHIPTNIAESIREGLGYAENPDEVREAFEVKAEGYKPPEAVQRAARRGLELRKKHGKGGLDTQEAGAQGIGSGVARATSLSNGNSVSIQTIRRMVAFFSRHEKNKEGGEDDAGYIAWQLWGGDAGRRWAEGILREVDGDDEKKSLEIKALADAINRAAEKMQPVVNITMPPYYKND